ncbi:energy transducer TonB family protein [Ramlibacter humi]|uniref:Energy transducer TonB n=1 Tax=Ramlibacter humi TaxID=2530451 RepID=A0A4Z0CDT9_9BURK|nr:energy transducer TonB [Ramlibacter humi]TFZ08728.1 energy transducer TonB [Ramlibacter humi]
MAGTDRLSPLDQPPLRLALAVAVAAHAALLLAPLHRAGAPSFTPEGARSLHVRLASVAQAILPSQEPPAAAPEPPSLAKAEPAAQPTPSRTAEAPAARDAADAAPASQAASPGDPDSVQYFTRDQLTVPPRPQSDVQVPYPDGVDDTTQRRVKVGLFIDAGGQVRRVRMDSADVPKPFEAEIQKAFLAARFSPGQREAVPVPAFIRIEVEFGPGAGR